MYSLCTVLYVLVALVGFLPAAGGTRQEFRSRGQVVSRFCTKVLYCTYGIGVCLRVRRLLPVTRLCCMTAKPTTLQARYCWKHYPSSCGLVLWILRYFDTSLGFYPSIGSSRWLNTRNR